MSAPSVSAIRKRAGNSRAAKACHPMVHFFDAIQRTTAMTDTPLALKAGLCPSIFSYWRAGSQPGLMNFDAALRVMGFRLAIARIEEEPEETILSREVAA